MELQELGVITPTGPHTTIQAAVNAATKSPGAAVWIPAWYTGGDSVPSAPGVPVFDMRGTSGSFTASSTFSAGTIDVTASPYNAKFDVQYSQNSNFSFSAGANAVVTCATCNFTSADVGKIIQATTFATFTTANAVTTTMAKTTIISVADSSHITVANASGSSTGTGVLMWGHDDTAAITSAVNAAATSSFGCQTVVFPGRSTFVSAAINPSSVTCVQGWSFTATHYVGIVSMSGGGNATFVPTTDFNLACPVNASYFFSFPGVALMNISIVGYGINPGGTASCSIVSSQTDATYSNLVITSWLTNVTNTVGFTYTANAGAHLYQNISSACAGQKSVVALANDVGRNNYSNFFSSCNGQPALTINTGASYDGDADDFEIDGSAVIFVQNSGRFTCRRCNFTPTGGVSSQSNLVSAQQGSYTELVDSVTLQNNANANSQIVATATGTGSTIVLRGNQLLQGGANAAGCVLYLGSVNDHFIDMGGNGYSGCILSNAGGGQLISLGTLTGFGTGATAAIDAESVNESGSATITTGTTPATSGNVPLNFAGTFSLNGNVPSCSFTLGNGSGTLTGPVSTFVGPASTTSVTVNWNAGGVLPAGTVKLYWNCRPR